MILPNTIDYKDQLTNKFITQSGVSTRFDEYAISKGMKGQLNVHGHHRVVS